MAVAATTALIAGGCRSQAEDAVLDSTVVQGAIDSTSPTSSSSSITISTTTTVLLDTGSEPSHAEFPEPTDGEVFDEYIASQVEGFAGAMRAAIESPTLTPENDFPDLARYAADPLLKVNYGV